MEYLEDYNTTKRHVVRKMAIVEGGLVYFRDNLTVEMLFPDGWTCI